MESNDTKKVVSKKQSGASSLRVKAETKKKVFAELAKINKKNFGRKVRPDQLITLLLTFLRPEHIQKLQEESLSNADRLEMKYREHVKKFGPVAKDEYLGLLLGESGKSESQSAANSQSKIASFSEEKNVK